MSLHAGIPSDGCSSFCTCVFEDIGHHHPGAVFGEGAGACLTNAAGGSGYDGGLSG
jgi:hypothetical protein